MKICSNCGKQLPDDSILCNACGTNVENILPEQPASPENTVNPAVSVAEIQDKPDTSADISPSPADAAQVEAYAGTVGTATDSSPAPDAFVPASAETDVKKKPLRMVVIVAALALILIIIFSSFFSLFFRKSDITTVDNSVLSYRKSDNNETVIFNNKDSIPLSGSSRHDIVNIERTKVFARIDGDRLQLITKKGIKEIDTGVSHFTSSIDRDMVVYFKNDRDFENMTDIYIWDGHKTKLIDTETVYDSIAISANGKYISYIKNLSPDKGDFDLYISVNGKDGVLQEKTEYIIKAISDDGKIRLAKNVNDHCLYILSDTNETKLGLEDGIRSVCFNNSLSEIFYSYNDRFYISKNADEPTEVFSVPGYISVLLPENKYVPVMVTYNYPDNYKVYKIDSFIGRDLIFNGAVVCRLDDELNLTEFHSGMGMHYLTEDENYLFYFMLHSSETGNSLFKSEYKNSDSEVKIADNVMSYAVAENGESIYYINKKGELYFSDGKNATLISENASNLKTADGGYAYYIKDEKDFKGELYCAKGKDINEKVENGNDVSYVECSGGRLYFSADFNGEYGTLYRADGQKSEFIADDVVYFNDIIILNK